jgi:DNA polymerase III sliding clamp (beta) subunit (PCNA family)
MNIQINREVLIKPLSSVVGIVEKRQALPILSKKLEKKKKNVINQEYTLIKKADHRTTEKINKEKTPREY